MAINLINVQGLTVTVDALAVDCPQIVGDLGETRPTTEYTCLSSNESVMALGSISRAPFTMTVLYNPEDTAGQDALRTAFDDNTTVEIVIELSDGGTTGTKLAFTGAVSGRTKAFPKDGAVGEDYTIEVSSSIVVTPAVA